MILIFSRDECLNFISKYKIVEVGKIVETLKMEHRKEWTVGVGNGGTQLILAARNQAGTPSGEPDWTMHPDPFSGEKERKLALYLE